jgi:hypothetical protein
MSENLKLWLWAFRKSAGPISPNDDRYHYLLQGARQSATEAGRLPLLHADFHFLLRINEQMNILGQDVRYLTNNVATQKIDQRTALRYAENQTRCANRGGDVNEGCGR